MAELKGQQTIECSVETCSFHDNNYCTLKSIQVAPCGHINNGVPEDETLCASYERMK
ncbi:MAG: DUF1540 domain-containing protein [Syntrophomonadaceae bacterium]|jgi:hypothetical protein